MKTEKEFHCLEFKREAQMNIYGEIKNLAPEEEIDYFRRRAESGVFGKLWRKLHGALAEENRNNNSSGTSIEHQASKDYQ